MMEMKNHYAHDPTKCADFERAFYRAHARTRPEAEAAAEEEAAAEKEAAAQSKTPPSMEHQTEKTGVEMRAVAPATRKTESVVGDAAVATSREELESGEEEHPAEQTGVETGVVAPSTPTTRSAVGNNVETKDDGAAAMTNREEFESEGENKQRRGGAEKKRNGSTGNPGNKASSAPISGLRRGNPAIQNSTPCGQSSEHGDTTPLKSAARILDQEKTKRKRRKKKTPNTWRTEMEGEEKYGQYRE